MKRKLLLSTLSLILLSTVAFAQETVEEPPIKVDTFLLTMPLVVKDKMGRNVSGLKKEDFSIVENGVKQNIEYFFNEESPMNVAILIDTSGSTREVLGKIQKAAREFVKVLRPEDKAMIVSFDYRTLFLSDLTSNKKTLAEAVNRTRIADQAGSDMNAAIIQMVSSHFNSFKGRKAVIVLSDGMVIRRDISTQQTLETLQKADTLFYPIVFRTKFYAEAMQRAENNKRKPLPMEMLEFLANETTGRFYEKDAADLKDAFQSIAEELKKQYLIGFYPQGTDTEYFQKTIRIAVDRKDLRIETKKRWQF